MPLLQRAPLVAHPLHIAGERRVLDVVEPLGSRRRAVRDAC